MLYSKVCHSHQHCQHTQRKLLAPTPLLNTTLTQSRTPHTELSQAQTGSLILTRRRGLWGPKLPAHTSPCKAYRQLCVLQLQPSKERAAATPPPSLQPLASTYSPPNATRLLGKHHGNSRKTQLWFFPYKWLNKQTHIGKQCQGSLLPAL